MNRVAKILGAALIFGGVAWTFAAFGELAAGFPLLFLFGARHGQEVWGPANGSRPAEPSEV